MPNDMVEKFISELKRANIPYAASKTRIVSKGVLVVTVLPTIKTKNATSYRLEIMKDMKVENEFSVAVLFATSLFGLMSIRRIGKSLKVFFMKGGVFEREYEGYHIVGTWDNDVKTLLAEPIKPPPNGRPKP
jgi:hypothetical protein